MERTTNALTPSPKNQSSTVRQRKSVRALTILTLGGIIAMSQFAIAHTPDAATDDRIDPQIDSFLAELNKDSPAETGMIGNIRAKSGGSRPDCSIARVPHSCRVPHI
jgi:hypothetical protein